MTRSAGTALSLGLAFLATGLLLGCQDSTSNPLAPDGPPARFTHNGKDHKGGGPGGGDGGGGDGPSSVTPWAEADATAHGVDAADPSTLASTCSGHPSNDTKPDVVWPRHDQCANILLQDGTLLTDDPVLLFGLKGDDIVWVQFREQDVIGSEGIQYESEKFSIDPPVPFTGAGMVLHIHAAGVPVYELKGHKSGPRVRQAGTMNLGDVEYR